MFIIYKIFNLKIDTKNKSITTITGLKQFDNNSVLNVTLLQNNLAIDLSNCTVRINFLREDDKVLLYMANIISAKEGKVSIKLSPKVLEKAGVIQADISVFDSNLFKITSATFNLKVEKAIFDDTYFTEKDLDLMQQEYTREKQRQDNENTRKINENNRVQTETKREQNENTRNSNEEARKKAESTRVDEWNNVKKDATNIKNTLDTTIDTANTANNNLKNTIATGDKLKEDLTPQNYVKNSDYEAYKKEANSQYEDLANKTIDSVGSNSNGDWIRFKDGTQICSIHHKENSLDIAVGNKKVYNWTYPASFVTQPSVTGSPNLYDSQGNVLSTSLKFVANLNVAIASRIVVANGGLNEWGGNNQNATTFIFTGIAIGRWK